MVAGPEEEPRVEGAALCCTLKADTSVHTTRSSVAISCENSPLAESQDQLLLR